MTTTPVKRSKSEDAKQPTRLTSVFSGQYNNALTVIWEFGTISDWIRSWSKINRAVRYFSRLDPAPMRRLRLIMIDYEDKSPDAALLIAWHQHPPCWQCGRKSNGVTTARLQAVNQGILDRCPTNIISYCKSHYTSLCDRVRKTHYEELAQQWKVAISTSKAKTLVPKARQRLESLLESVPDASPALKRKLQSLVNGILEDAQECFTVEGWTQTGTVVSRVLCDWTPTFPNLFTK